MPTIEEIRTALGGAKSSKIQESFQKYSAESPKSAKLFAPIEQLESEIRDKDKIIENLKKESIELKNQVSIAEKEKSTILEELNNSKWMENTVASNTKKIYEDKIKTMNIVDSSKLIPLLIEVSREKQGNEKLNWGNWLKIPENLYLLQINESIARKVFEDTNVLIDRAIDNINKRRTRGGSTTIPIYGLEFDGLTQHISTEFADGESQVIELIRFG